jgi:hypothetical protein
MSTLNAARRAWLPVELLGAGDAGGDTAGSRRPVDVCHQWPRIVFLIQSLTTSRSVKKHEVNYVVSSYEESHPPASSVLGLQTIAS